MSAIAIPCPYCGEEYPKPHMLGCSAVARLSEEVMRKIAPPPPAPSDGLVRPWRCNVTGNPVGTDTHRIGAPPCDCNGCRAAARITALEAERADKEAECSGAMGAWRCARDERDAALEQVRRLRERSLEEGRAYDAALEQARALREALELPLMFHAGGACEPSKENKKRARDVMNYFGAAFPEYVAALAIALDEAEKRGAERVRHEIAMAPYRILGDQSVGVSIKPKDPANG